jgi:hypothetical protein
MLFLGFWTYLGLVILLLLPFYPFGNGNIYPVPILPLYFGDRWFNFIISKLEGNLLQEKLCLKSHLYLI